MIQFKVGNRWTEEHVAIRMAQIITGHARKFPDQLSSSDSLERESRLPPFKDERNNKWQLNIGNDWWLRKIADHEYSLNYRYDGTPDREKMLADIVPFLQFIFFYQG